MIRHATLKDVEAIATIITAAWKTAYKGIIDPDYADHLKIDKYRDIFTQNINDEKEIILVNHDTIVNGFVSGVATAGQYDCEIVGLYVHPEYQHKGIGTALLKTMVDHFMIKGKKNLIIWTLNGAKNNLFYKQAGGIKKEDKKLVIGGKLYSGVGFHIQIGA